MPPPRSWLRRVHRLLALSVGAWFVVAGLTGSLLAFYPEIDSRITPLALRAGPPATYEQTYRFLRLHYPARSATWRIEIGGRGEPIQARSLSDSDRAGASFAPLIVWLDPVGPRVLREAQWGHYAMTWIYDLHYHLLVGPAGAVPVGLLGVSILVLLCTGVAAWWPRSGSTLRKALVVRRGATRSRRLYDIHKVFGLAAAMLCLPIVATGVAISFPDVTAAMLAAFSAESTPTAISAPSQRGSRLPIDAAAAAAQKALRHGNLAWIETPADSSGAYIFRFRVPADPNRRFPASAVTVDPHSGAILFVRDATSDRAADRITTWLHPLHNGEAFGTAGRCAALLAGLLPLILFLSGTLRWFTRRRSIG